MYGRDVHVLEFVANVALNNILRCFFLNNILEPPNSNSTGNSHSKNVTCTYLTYLLTDITLILKIIMVPNIWRLAPLIDWDKLSEDCTCFSFGKKCIILKDMQKCPVIKNDKRLASEETIEISSSVFVLTKPIGGCIIATWNSPQCRAIILHR